MTMEITEKLLPLGTTKVTQKDPDLHGKSKIRREHFNGIEANQFGDLMRKERLIDRDSDHYYEHVQDLKTGQVVHHVNTSLKEHQGHGSAKVKNK